MMQRNKGFQNNRQYFKQCVHGTNSALKIIGNRLYLNVCRVFGLVPVHKEKVDLISSSRL